MEKTPFELSLEQGLHALDSKLGPRKYMGDVRSAAEIDEIAFTSGNEIISDEVPVPIGKILAKSSLVRAILETEDQKTVREENSFLYQRRSTFKNFLINYEIASDSDECKGEKCDEVIKNGEYKSESLEIKLNFNSITEGELYYGREWGSNYLLVKISRAKEGDVEVLYDFDFIDDLKDLDDLDEQEEKMLIYKDQLQQLKHELHGKNMGSEELAKNILTFLRDNSE